MNLHFKYIIISLLLIFFQSTVAVYISLNEIIPDILLIWIVYIAIKRGQITATIYGFWIGLIFDFASGGFIGLSSMTKSACGFISGYFYNENRIDIVLGSYRFLLIVLFASIIHNFIYLLIFIQGTEINLWKSIIQIGGITALYTTTVSIITVFIYGRKYSFRT